jgi:hypothetical protein
MYLHMATIVCQIIFTSFCRKSSIFLLLSSRPVEVQSFPAARRIAKADFPSQNKDFGRKSGPPGSNPVAPLKNQGEKPL